MGENGIPNDDTWVDPAKRELRAGRFCFCSVPETGDRRLESAVLSIKAVLAGDPEGPGYAYFNAESEVIQRYFWPTCAKYNAENRLIRLRRARERIWRRIFQLRRYFRWRFSSLDNFDVSKRSSKHELLFSYIDFSKLIIIIGLLRVVLVKGGS